MKKVLLALLGLILLAILSFFCFQDKASTIRDSLESSTTTALETANITNVTASLKGTQLEMTDIIKLTGEVATPQAKAKAETLARAIEGVGGVDNQLVVNQQVAAVMPEEEPIAASNEIDPYTLTIVKDAQNKLLLKGYVQDESQQKMLLTQADTLFGSENVTDNITVATGAPEDWEHISTYALERLHDVDYGDMKLSNQTYEFTGHLPSPSAKEKFLDGIREVMANPENKYSRYRGDYIITAPIEEVIVTKKEEKAEPTPSPEIKKATISDCQIKIDTLLKNNKILFEHNKATIRTNSFTVLDNVFKTLNECQTTQLEIAGHTDATGSKSYNLQLSNSRSNSIKTYFVKKGFMASSINAVGYGETRPIASNDNRKDRTKNRRIEFIVKGVK